MQKLTFPNDIDKIRISGRNLVKDNTLYFDWSGAFVELVFTGKKLTANIKTDFWDCDRFYGRIAVIVNDDKENATYIMLDNGVQKDYTLYECDEEKTVTIRIVKISEAAFAKVGYTAIEVDGVVLAPLKAKYSRKIEVIGDSITCGYGVEAKAAEECYSTATQNPLKAYSTLIAEKCSSEYQLVSWSGIGIVSNYVDPEVEEPLNNWLMPPLYPYTDKGLENVIGFKNGASHEEWDFSKYVPDVIVINLGTNDQSWVRQIPEREELFSTEYTRFLTFIREKNPNAYIVCTYGIMGTALADVLTKTVAGMNDDKITHFPLTEHLAEDGYGADWHPSAISHIKVADKLAPYINSIFEKIGK